MSFHFYRVDKLASEEQLLRKKLMMENQIREQQKRNRYSKNAESQKYSRILEPVTKSIEQLKSKDKPIEPNVGNLIDFDDVDVDSNELSFISDEKPGELYFRALDTIPVRLIDDGLFGLNIKTGEIGNNRFSVGGDRLTIQNKINGSVKIFDIKDIDLWRLLLVLRPSAIKLNLESDHGRRIVDEYRKIASEINLLEDAKNSGMNFKIRAKFRILNNMKQGSGFLFSVRPPPFLFHPSTVVIPSDKEGLLRELLQAVAELRAGNTSMQNIVVPLAHEAKRRRILPPGLLTPDELTWIFA